MTNGRCPWGAAPLRSLPITTRLPHRRCWWAPTSSPTASSASLGCVWIRSSSASVSAPTGPPPRPHPHPTALPHCSAPLLCPTASLCPSRRAAVGSVSLPLTPISLFSPFFFLLSSPLPSLFALLYPHPTPRPTPRPTPHPTSPRGDPKVKIWSGTTDPPSGRTASPPH